MIYTVGLYARAFQTICSLFKISMLQTCIRMKCVEINEDYIQCV